MLKLSDSENDTRILLDAISKDKIHLARFVLDALDEKIVDCETEGAQTPLISAVFLQDPSARSRFVSLLLQRGARVDLPDEDGRTALSYACEMGRLDAVKILVKNGADPEAADSWGNTALMYAVVSGHAAVVEFLVRAFKRLGLQIERQNKVGNSAVELARYLRHTDCLHALLSRSRRALDADALAERLSTVSISDEEQSSQIHDGTRRASGLTRSISSRRRIQSMDSIEEYEREGDPSSPRGQVFSGVFTPKPPQKHSNDHLPPLFYSPRTSKTPSSCTPASGPLGILLTPFSKSSKEELEKAKTLACDAPGRRFDDCYYQKRCSLPTPERIKPLRKSRAGSEHGSRSLSTLRLLRRFTFPEFKRSSRESPEAPEAPARCMPRSETFPLGNKHPQVGSKPSIDSISAVKCEFDFQFKAGPDDVCGARRDSPTNSTTAGNKPLL